MALLWFPANAAFIHARWPGACFHLNVQRAACNLFVEWHLAPFEWRRVLKTFVAVQTLGPARNGFYPLGIVANRTGWLRFHDEKKEIVPKKKKSRFFGKPPPGARAYGDPAGRHVRARKRGTAPHSMRLAESSMPQLAQDFTPRLEQVRLGLPRFTPRTEEETMHAIYTWWNILDAQMNISTKPL